MSTRIDEIRGAAGTEEPIKVIDSILHSGIIVMGNRNDFVNMSMRVAPNMTPEELDDLIEQLSIKGVEEGTKLIYKLTTDSSDSNVYEKRIGNMNLSLNIV